MSSTLHALTEKTTLVDTDEFYLVQDPYTAGNDRRASLANLKKHFAQNTLAAGTLAASAPMTLTQTWDGVGVTFIGHSIDITDINSAAASLPFRVRVGGSNMFSVNKGGEASVALNLNVGSAIAIATQGMSLSSTGVLAIDTAVFSWSSTNSVFDTADLVIRRDASDTFAQRRGTNAQVKRLYRTFTDTSNYERQAFQSGVGYFEWVAETAGTGTDDISLRLTPSGAGQVLLGAIPYSATAPALSMVGQTGTGISWSGNGLFFSSSGSSIGALSNTGLSLTPTSIIGFASGAPDLGAADTLLRRDGAAGALAQRLDTSAQTFRVYRTFTDTSNYERQAFQSGAGYFEWAAETAGTGTDDISLRLTPSGAGIVIMNDLSLRQITMPRTSTLTIAAGVITITGSYHDVDTEGAAGTDDLDTINGGVDGDRLVLRANNSARTVVVKDGTGNLQLAGDMSLDNVQDTIELIYDATLTAWLEVGRSDNGA